MTETCRICLTNASPNKLIAPCKCSGSQKYVHASCLEEWQETVMVRILTFPSTSSANSLSKCSTCNYPYTEYKKNSNQIYFSPQLQRYWDKYYKVNAALVLMSILGFILINWLWMGLILLSSGFITFTYLGVRPQVTKTSRGWRISLISIGRPVNDLKKGILIESTNKIGKGIFANTKVLITEYTQQKAIGFIINKTLSTPAKVIAIGGPVRISESHILHTSLDAEESQMVTPGVYYGGKLQANTRCLKVNGHAEWKSLQLDGEIRCGMWKILGLATSEDILQ